MAITCCSFNSWSNENRCRKIHSLL